MNLSDARFKKIAYNPKEDRVRIEYEVDNGTEEPDEYSAKIRQPPHEDFIEALSALRPHVVDLCEAPLQWEEQIEVRSVTLTWKHDVMGAVITGLRQLSRSMSPLVLNTPHETVEPYSEEGESDPDLLLSEDAVDALRVLVLEAKRFLGGKRGTLPQADLFQAPESAEAGELAGV